MGLRCPKCNVDLEVRLTAAPPMQADQARRGTVTDGAVDIGSLLDAIDFDKLDGKAADFVAQTRERYEQYKGRTRMSDKQMAWLKQIVAEQAGDGWE